MVGEFPELQGLMGKYYALAQGEDASVAAACEEHYKPLGPADRVPTNPVSVAVALADKIDTLVGFWAIDEKPTGSKDPYALRRAALGVIRIVLISNLELSPREDFLPVRVEPRVTPRQISALTESLRAAGLELASLWTVYRWADPHDAQAVSDAASKTAAVAWPPSPVSHVGKHCELSTPATSSRLPAGVSRRILLHPK